MPGASISRVLPAASCPPKKKRSVLPVCAHPKNPIRRHGILQPAVYGCTGDVHCSGNNFRAMSLMHACYGPLFSSPAPVFSLSRDFILIARPRLFYNPGKQAIPDFPVRRFPFRLRDEENV